MEFERSIFRIHERLMSYHKLPDICKIIIYISSSFAAINIIVLLIFHFAYINTGTILADIISDQLLDGATKYRSADFNMTFNGSELYMANDTVLLPEDIY